MKARVLRATNPLTNKATALENTNPLTTTLGNPTTLAKKKGKSKSAYRIPGVFYL